MHSFWSDNMNEKQKQYQSAVKKKHCRMVPIAKNYEVRTRTTTKAVSFEAFIDVISSFEKPKFFVRE